MRIGVMYRASDIDRGVTLDAISMYDALRRAGFDAHLFTEVLVGERRPLFTRPYADADWLLGGPDDLMICHVSGEDSAALSILRRLTCRLVIRYHGLTASHFATPFSLALASEGRRAHRMLSDFLALPVSFAVSTSSAAERHLIDFGFPASRCRVAPPFHDASSLVGVPDDPASVARISVNAFNILAIADIAPESGLDVMVAALAKVRGAEGAEVVLHILGNTDARMASYETCLAQTIGAAGLTDSVIVHDGRDRTIQGTLQRHVDLFWSGRQCPGSPGALIAAMAAGLPALLTTQSGLAEFGGDAAIIADSAEEMAATIARLIRDDGALPKLRNKMAQQASLFSEHFIEQCLLNVVADFRDPELFVGPDTHTEWFWLPNSEGVARAIRAASPRQDLHTSGFRRAAVFEWLQSPTPSQELLSYLHSDELRSFANALPMPAGGLKLSLAARLLWWFSTYAREVFPLASEASVAGFMRWYLRRVSSNLAPLMSEFELSKMGVPAGIPGYLPAS